MSKTNAMSSQQYSLVIYFFLANTRALDTRLKLESRKREVPSFGKELPDFFLDKFTYFLVYTLTHGNLE